MPKRVWIPAISREIEFIAQHANDADDIRNENVSVDASLRELTNAVYERADGDVRKLLNELQGQVSNGVQGLLRIKWTRSADRSWEQFGAIYTPRGKKKGIGNVGLHVGFGKLAGKLIGWVFPRGGLDGRKNYVRKCERTMPEVHLVSERADQYPGWEDCVVWFTTDLTTKTSRDDLGR